ncbi:MAG: hypothetical protein EOO85_09950, partial [Pedobacter sp.]
MNKITYILLTLVVLIVFSLKGNAQVIREVKNAFDSYQQNRPQEKIFVQTDKSFYLTGELMWFKVFIVDASGNGPTILSKVAYVDVLDKNNNSLLQAKIAISNGSGSGSFYIPVTALNGNYTLRGYTNLMKNYGPESFFENNITIVNPMSEPEQIAKKKADLDLQFFPEGGDLVGGLKSQVGFKVMGNDNMGKNFAGVVINQKNDTVAKFKTFKFGIGRFTFTPEANSTYKAIGRADDGT